MAYAAKKPIKKPGKGSLIPPRQRPVNRPNKPKPPMKPKPKSGR